MNQRPSEQTPDKPLTPPATPPQDLFWTTCSSVPSTLSALRRQKVAIYTTEFSPRRGEGAAAFLKTLARLATDAEDAEDVASFGQAVDGARRRHPEAAHLYDLISMVGDRFEENDDGPGPFDEWVEYLFGTQPQMVMAWFMERIFTRHGLRLVSFEEDDMMSALALVPDPGSLDGSVIEVWAEQAELHKQTGMWDVLNRVPSVDAAAFAEARQTSPEQLSDEMHRNVALSLGIVSPVSARDHVEVGIRAFHSSGQTVASMLPHTSAALRLLLAEEGLSTRDLDPEEVQRVPEFAFGFTLHSARQEEAFINVTAQGISIELDPERTESNAPALYEHARTRLGALLTRQPDPGPMNRSGPAQPGGPLRS